MDPYLKFTLNGAICKTKTHNGGGKTPTWNDTLTFDNVSGDEIVNFTAWDKDDLKDDFIGEGTLSLAPIKKAVSYKDWVSIHHKGKEAGKIYLEATFISTDKAPKAGFAPAMAPGGYAPQPAYAPQPGYAP